MRLEHVNLTVADLERSIGFYCTLLGLRVRWQGMTAGGTPAAHVGDDAMYLALFEGRGTAPTWDYSTVGYNHMGFVVDDLDAARARLEAQGAPIHAVDPYEPGRRLYFTDPDGLEVELVEYPAA